MYFFSQIILHTHRSGIVYPSLSFKYDDIQQEVDMKKISFLFLLSFVFTLLVAQQPMAGIWKDTTEAFSKSSENIFEKWTKAFDDLRKPDWQRFLESPIGIIIVVGGLIIIILLVVKRRR